MAKGHEKMTLEEALTDLREHADGSNLAGMAKFGIDPSRAYGTPLPSIRALGKRIGRDRELALKLWRTGTREAMILATIIDDPKLVTEEQMESWVRDIYDWESCDQLIMNLFQKSPHSWKKAFEWSGREAELVRRAGFVLMARIASADKRAEDAKLLEFLPLILEGSMDDRPLVRKGVSWALRQMGKRSALLHSAALVTASQMKEKGNRSSKWVAADVLKDIERESIKKKFYK